MFFDCLVVSCSTFHQGLRNCEVTFEMNWSTYGFCLTFGNFIPRDNLIIRSHDLSSCPPLSLSLSLTALLSLSHSPLFHHLTLFTDAHTHTFSHTLLVSRSQTHAHHLIICHSLSCATKILQRQKFSSLFGIAPKEVGINFNPANRVLRNGKNVVVKI